MQGVCKMSNIQHCEAHGEYTPKVVSILNKKIQLKCSKCRAEEANDIDSRHRKTGYLTRLASANIPSGYTKKRIKDLKIVNVDYLSVINAISNYLKSLRENIGSGRSVILTGSVGSGKTHMACSAIHYAVKDFDYSAHYVNASCLFREITASYDEKGTTEKNILKKYASYDLLAIDDVGMQKGTSFESQILTDLVNLRYQDKKSTMIVSNCTHDKLGKFLDLRAIDRLRENNGLAMNIKCESYRKQSVS
jgi:DNA replication protein DnaC